MPLATYELSSATEVTATTVLPRGTIVTYTCEDGNEYEDEALAKTAECSVGGVWEPDLPNTDVCQRKHHLYVILQDDIRTEHLKFWSVFCLNWKRIVPEYEQHCN